MTWDEACAVAGRLCVVEAGTYHGYPALRTRGRFLMRLGEDGASVEFKGLAADEREVLLAAEPAVFFLPAGFGGAGVYARLEALDAATLAGLLQRRLGAQ